MLRLRSAFVVAAGWLPLFTLPVAATAQQPIAPPMRAGESVSIGGDIGRYRALWGPPEFRALDDDSGRPWPNLHNIKTVGAFDEIPGKRRGEGGWLVGKPLEFDSKYTTHMVCGERRCLAIMPVFELRDAFFTAAVDWRQQDVEIIGAFDHPQVTGPNSDDQIWVFHVWSIGLASTGFSRRTDSRGSTLESLVRSPGAVTGRSIIVTGVFRGANLFDDLPSETRRRPSDWVLRDGAFSVWVTGKEPKGSGWALDVRSRGDCRHRLEVRGRIETAGGFVYLRAQELTLLGPARDQDEEPSNP